MFCCAVLCSVLCTANRVHWHVNLIHMHMHTKHTSKTQLIRLMYLCTYIFLFQLHLRVEYIYTYTFPCQNIVFLSLPLHIQMCDAHHSYSSENIYFELLATVKQSTYWIKPFFNAVLVKLSSHIHQQVFILFSLTRHFLCMRCECLCDKTAANSFQNSLHTHFSHCSFSHYKKTRHKTYSRHVWCWISPLCLNIFLCQIAFLSLFLGLFSSGRCLFCLDIFFFFKDFSL